LIRLLLVAILRGCVILFVTLLLVFVILRMLPSDPALMLLQRDATPEQIAQVRQLWGLDQPVYVQFWVYLSNLIRGDAGNSFQYSVDPGSRGIPALALVLSRFPATVELALVSLAISFLVSVPLGMLTAVKRDTFLDHAVLSAVLLIGSLPNFLIGLLFIFYFALVLGVLPTGGTGSPLHIVLPALTLALHFSVILVRLTHTEVTRALNSDYVRTARSKGLANWAVVWGHAMKNAALPLVTVTGLRLGSLLNGAVVVETLFGWPGIGRLMIEAIAARDYPVIQVIVPLSALMFVVTNIVVDLMYAVLDPRVRMASR
jgi:peptide/nickel transport system permease protein